jgi:hypothetical protein
MDQWLVDLKATLGLEDEIEVDEVLKLARVVAHRVERRAAPVTTYVVGLARARAGDTTALTAAMDLARRWPAPQGRPASGTTE